MDALHDGNRDKRSMRTDEYEILMCLRDILIEFREIIEIVYGGPSDRLDLIYNATMGEIEELVGE